MSINVEATDSSAILVDAVLFARLPLFLGGDGDVLLLLFSFRLALLAPALIAASSRGTMLDSS